VSTESAISRWYDHPTLRRFLASEAERRPALGSHARTVAALKGFFRFLVENEYLERDPTLVLRTTKKREALPDVLDRRELARLLEAAERDDVWQRGYAGKRERDRLLLALFACAGLRRAGSRAAKSGGGGIRTHEGLARPAAFKTGRKVPICRQSSARSPVHSPASDQLCQPR